MSLTASPLSRAEERVVVAVLALGVFAVALNTNMVGPLLPFMAQDPIYALVEPAVRKAQSGQLLGAAGIAGAVAGLLLGPAVDRLGRRTTMLAGAVVFVLAMAAHALPQSHGTLLALRALSGLGGGLVYTSASAAVADVVPYERRGAAMGVFTAGLFLAIPVGLPIGSLIAQQGVDAWRWAFAALALPGLAAMFGFLRWLPNDRAAPGQKVTQLEVLRMRHVMPSLLSMLLYTGAFFTAVQLVAKWLDESRLLVKEQQPLLWVVLGLGTAAGSLVLPRLADRIGKRPFVLATTAGVAVCVLLLGRVETLTGLWLVGAPLALLAASRSAALQALMSELVEPRLRGTLMGLKAAAVNAGTGLLAWAGGLIYADSGYTGVTTAAALTVLASYVLIRWFVKVKL